MSRSDYLGEGELEKKEGLRWNKALLQSNKLGDQINKGVGLEGRESDARRGFV